MKRDTSTTNTQQNNTHTNTSTNNHNNNRRTNNSVDDDLDLLLLEYLGHCGYDRALDALKAHIKTKRNDNALWKPVGADVRERIKLKLATALDHGARDEAMHLWQTFVPPLVRHTEPAAKKLEFYLQIYFAVFAVHPANREPAPARLAQTMRDFKAYLESDGADLATTPEFLAYYAMPYVHEIERHPSFKELFTLEWATALKARLADFLSVTPQFAAEPRLLKICRSYKEMDPQALVGGTDDAQHPVNSAARELEAMRERLTASELRAAELQQTAIEREAAMQRGSYEALQVAGELLIAVKEGGQFNMRSIETRINKARERVGLGPLPTGGGGGGKAAGGGARDALGQTMRNAPMAALDYERLKDTIFNHAQEAPLVLLALRWRLTKSARRQRKAALSQYIANDLLSASVLGVLVDADAPPQLREEALRLVNLFASEASGRSYLLAKPDLVVSLCKLLTLENADSTARQNALGTLQKLSLRRQPQNTMIDADIIAWLARMLSEVDSLSQYSVEYGTALLMNLSLRTAGKGKCAEPDIAILDVLSQLMESDSLQVRTYVNGTLYSILVRAPLKEKAREIGLPESLEALIEHSDGTLARQINYILEQLEAPPVEDDGNASEADDDEEEDDDEDEGEEEDEDELDLFVESELDPEASGGAVGEELLCSRYIAGVDEAQRDFAQLEAAAAERAAAAAARGSGDDQQADDDIDGGGGGLSEPPPRPPAAQLSASKPLPGRKYHSADEPLQRPSTPGDVPWQPPDEPEPQPERSAPAELPARYLADDDPIDAPEDRVFAMRLRVPRTPQAKSRSELAPLQPATKRSEQKGGTAAKKAGRVPPVIKAS